MNRGPLYTVLFALAVALVCSVLVSSAAVSLAPRQAENQALDREERILEVAGLLPTSGAITREVVRAQFEARIRPRIIRLETGEADTSVDVEAFDPRRVVKDPKTSRVAPANAAQVLRVPTHARIYEALDDAGGIERVILPIEGKGLWSTLYGYLAVDRDGTTVRGLIYYAHGETPGLGGEVDNPRWRALWAGRKIFDAHGAVRLQVVKGRAGPPEADPHRVDSISGATLTTNGVTHMLAFWMGEHGFGPYLAGLRGGSR